MSVCVYVRTVCILLLCDQCTTHLWCACVCLLECGHSSVSRPFLLSLAVNIDRATEVIIAASRSFSVHKPAEVQPEKKKPHRSRSFGANVGELWTAAHLYDKDVVCCSVVV